jgi:hypothetical protein
VKRRRRSVPVEPSHPAVNLAAQEQVQAALAAAQALERAGQAAAAERTATSAREREREKVGPAEQVEGAVVRGGRPPARSVALKKRGRKKEEGKGPSTAPSDPRGRGGRLDVRA